MGGSDLANILSPEFLEQQLEKKNAEGQAAFEKREAEQAEWQRQYAAKMTAEGFVRTPCSVCAKEERWYKPGETYICGDACRTEADHRRLIAATDRSEWMKRAGVPAIYRKAKLSEFSENIVREIREPHPEGVVITGPTGTGKTYLAAAFLSDSLPKLMRGYGFRVQWSNVPNLLYELRKTFHRRASTQEQEIVDEHLNQKLLILDDLGAEKASEWTAQTLYLIVSGRYEEHKPTIITTNLSLAEVDQVDPRLASRLGGMHYIKLTGTDRRMTRPGV